MDCETGAANVSGEGGCQKQAGFSDIGGNRHSSKWHCGGYGRQPGLITVMQVGLLGFHEANNKSIDPHLGRPFDRERAAEVYQSCFGGPVGGGARRRTHRANAGYVDDTSSGRLFLHYPVGGLTEI